MVKNVLGRPNYVSLDMDELGERFSTTTMFGKLANIGDDISDEFLQGKVIVIRDFIPHQKKVYPSHYQKVRCSLI